MHTETDSSRIVPFVRRAPAPGPAAAPADPAGAPFARAVDQLATLVGMILRLERLVADAPAADPLRLVAARAVATMKLDALRIAATLALLPGMAPAGTSLDPEPERQAGTP